jgi:hypothetical protein
MTKISQKSLFHLCEDHILARLDTTMLYIIFKGFEKYHFSPQNLNGSASVLLKNFCLRQKQTKNLYFISVRVIFRLD